VTPEEFAHDEIQRLVAQVEQLEERNARQARLIENLYDRGTVARMRAERRQRRIEGLVQAMEADGHRADRARTQHGPHCRQCQALHWLRADEEARRGLG
jgi:uncharacterized coiled-coil protein SlyX